MSEKIGMPALTAMLSVRTGDSKEQTEGFLHEFFGLITAGLEAGDSIKIPGVGIFKTINVEARKSVNVNTGEETVILEHRKVVFLPGKELAATVNAPFEMFQTMELTDDLAAVFEEPQTEPEPEPVVEQKEKPEVVDPERDPESDQSDLKSENAEKLEEAEEFKETEDSEELEEVDTPDYYDDSETEQPVVVKRRFWPGFFVGFGAACLCMLIAMGIVAYMTLTDPDNDNMTVTAVTPAPVATQTVPADSAARTAPADAAPAAMQTTQAETPAVPTQPSDRPVYDTISKTRYLTTMAKDHYGNFHLWPYIYMENEKILGHPDRIKPGTQVVVPDLAKYGVDPKNPADIEKAKKLGQDIYARYNK